MSLKDHVWTENIPSPLGERELAKWQKRINKAAGMYNSETPNVVLLWGMDNDPKYQIYDRVRNRWTMPYISKHSWVDGEDIGVARYFLRLLDPFLVESPNLGARTESVSTPEMYNVGTAEEPIWKPTGHDIKEDVFTMSRAQFRGLPYTRYRRWSLDSPANEVGMRECCFRQMEKGLPCYGEYLPPDDRMIAQIEEQFFVARNYAGNEQDALKWVRASEALADMEKQKKAEELQKEMRSSVHDYFSTMGQAGQGKLGRWSTAPGSRVLRPS